VEVVVSEMAVLAAVGRVVEVVEWEDIWRMKTLDGG
jgi:hypothetical protein